MTKQGDEKGTGGRKMKRNSLTNMRNKVHQFLLILLPLTMILGGCAGLNPQNVDVELQTTPPREKTTSFREALSDLGRMTEIYGTDMLFIQSNPLGDETGTSSSTGGEVPRDITEMMKSSLNSIGGKVVYIPYDPSFIQNNMVTGYSNFHNKLVPNVVLSGGITEFDRGLETRGDNTDASADVDFNGMPDWLPTKTIGLKYRDAAKYGLARITLDFNLLDYQTMSGLSKMTAVNTMEVHKALGEKEIGISIFGPTFGLRGDIKKVQGRHAAVRLLVELGTIQIVGKYLVVPYWRLLGDEAKPDEVIIDAVSRYFYSLSERDRISTLQTWLYLYGYDVNFTGVLDEATKQALQQVDITYNPGAKTINLQTFQTVFTYIPLTDQALARRQAITRMIEQQKQQAALERQQAVAAAAQQQAEQAKETRVITAPDRAVPAPKKVEHAKETKSITASKTKIVIASDSAEDSRPQGVGMPAFEKSYAPETERENITPPSRKGIGRVVSKDALIKVLGELSQ
jgi:hypothetical protein